MANNSSYTVDEFCEAERLSRSMLYKLWGLGEGPRFYYVGNVRRISHEARLEWQRQMEAASEEGGARGPSQPTENPAPLKGIAKKVRADAIARSKEVSNVA